MIYVLWFIPNHFWRPFEDRSALVVFNLSIVAVVFLMANAVPGFDELHSARFGGLLRRALLALSLLTFLLNAYALIADVWRIAELGLTPNRHAVLGWNVVTLAMLALLVGPLLRESPDWVASFRRSLIRIMVAAAVWALWVLWFVPNI